MFRVCVLHGDIGCGTRLYVCIPRVGDSIAHPLADGSHQYGAVVSEVLLISVGDPLIYSMDAVIQIDGTGKPTMIYQPEDQG